MVAGAEAVHLHARDAAGRESLAARMSGPRWRRCGRPAPAPAWACRPGCGSPAATRGPGRPRWPGGPAWTTPPARLRLGQRVRAGLDPARRDPAPGGHRGRGRRLVAGRRPGAGRVPARRPADPHPGRDLDGPAGTAIDRADQILAELDRSGAREPRLLHGEGDACWPLVAHAGALGLPSRIGLEDTLTGPYGEAVTGNAELVRLGLAAWRSAAPRPLRERTLRETRVPAERISRKRQKARS